MLSFSNDWSTGHEYSLVFIGNGKTISKTFSSRHAANSEMYNIMEKRKLQIKEIYDDKHDKTYICNSGAEFHINRI